MVKCALATQPRDVDPESILRAIKTGKWEKPIREIRHLYRVTLLKIGKDQKAAKLAVDSLKKNLPGLLWSGRFARRANDALIEHSGLLGTDFDSLGSKLAEVREKLLNSPHLWALFLSPTGDGLKAIFRVLADASKHLGSFLAVERHVLDITGVQVDQACKDVARLCFVSYDPEAYFNPNAREIQPLAEAGSLKSGLIQKSAEPDSRPDKAQIREMLAVIPKRPNYADWIRIVAAVGDALPDEDAIELLKEWSPEEQEGEYADKLQHRLENVHIGTLIHLAKQRGWRPKVAQDEKRPDLWKGPEFPLPTSYKPDVKIVVQSAGEVLPVELRPPPPPYRPPPLTLLPSVLQKYIAAGAESLNVDVAFILLPQLSSLGAAIGNSRSILLKRGFIQPAVIWTGIIGKSTSRKSPSNEEGCFAVTAHEQELMRQNKHATELYEEELSQWEGKKGQKREPKPKIPAFLTCKADDLTIEALAYLLIENPRGVLVCKDELSHWIASFDQYKNNTKGSDVSRWLSLHNGAFLAVDRRTDNRHYRILHPRVCITGGIQAKILRRVLTTEFFERGLPARFLFAYPPFRQDKWSEATIPDKIRAKALKVFADLWLLQTGKDDKGDPAPKLLTLDKDAKAVFVDFYNECGEAAVEADEHELPAWGKLTGYGARLALVGQLARDPNAEVVTGETMQAACDLARWSGNEAVRTYAMLAETRQQREMRELLEFIERRGGTVSVRDIMQFYRPLRDQRNEAERQLGVLVRNGFGKWFDDKGSRGPTARKFQMFSVSTSTGFGKIRGEKEKPVDVDRYSSPEVTPAEEPVTEPVPAKEPASPPADVSPEIDAFVPQQAATEKLRL
jgi:hypothetical protein